MVGPWSQAPWPILTTQCLSNHKAESKSFLKSTYLPYSSKLTATSKNPSVYGPRRTLPFIRISPIGSSVRQFCSTLRLWAFTAQWLSKSVTFFKKLLRWLSSAWKLACSFTIAAQVQLQLASAVDSSCLWSNPDSPMQLAWLFWDLCP